MKLPMLDVHEVLAYVHDVAKLRSPKSHIEFYWSWGQKFGAQWSRLGGPSVIPCGLYADETKYGGPFSQEKVLGIFLNLVLHRPRSIRYSRFCIFSVRSALMLGTRTLYPIFRRIVWGFHLAYKGVRPDGSALCSDGATFLCTELRGDLAWHKMIWNFLECWVAGKRCMLVLQSEIWRSHALYRIWWRCKLGADHLSRYLGMGSRNASNGQSVPVSSAPWFLCWDHTPLFDAQRELGHIASLQWFGIDS